MGALLDAFRQSLSPYMEIWRRYIWHFFILYVVLLGVVLLTLVSKLNGENPVSVRGTILELLSSLCNVTNADQKRSIVLMTHYR